MDLENAVRCLRQLREVLATISSHAGAMSPQAISSIAALAVKAADETLTELGAS